MSTSVASDAQGKSPSRGTKKPGIRSRRADQTKQQQATLGNVFQPKEIELGLEDLRKSPRDINSQEGSLQLGDVMGSPLRHKKNDPMMSGHGSGSTATTAVNSSLGWGPSTSHSNNSLPVSPVAAAVPVVPDPHPHSAPAETGGTSRGFLRDKLKLGRGSLYVASSQAKRFLPEIKMPFDTSQHGVRFAGDGNPQDGKSKKNQRMSFIKIPNFTFGGGKFFDNNMLPLEEEDATTSTVPDALLAPPPHDSLNVRAPSSSSMADAIEKKLTLTERAFEDVEAKQRRREKRQGRAQKKKHAGPGKEEPPSKSRRGRVPKSRLNQEAKERLKKHSEGSELRRNAANRERRKQVLAASKPESGNHMPKENEDERLGRKGEAVEEGPPVTSKPLRTVSGKARALYATSTHAPDSAARREKKQEDEKLRERVRQRASVHVEPSYALSELLKEEIDHDQDYDDDKDDTSFAEDIAEDFEEAEVAAATRSRSKDHKWEDSFTFEGQESSSSITLESLQGSSRKSMDSSSRTSLRGSSHASLNNSSRTSLNGSRNMRQSMSLDATSLHGSAVLRTSLLNSPSERLASSAPADLALQTIESHRSNNYLQLAIESVPSKSPSPPGSVSSHVEKMAGGNMSKLEGGKNRSKENSSSRKRSEGKTRSVSQPRPRSEDKPSRSSHRKLKDNSEPRKSTRRNSSDAVEDEEGGLTAETLISSDQSGNESFSLLNLVGSKGDKSNRSFGGSSKNSFAPSGERSGSENQMSSKRHSGNGSDVNFHDSNRSEARYMIYKFLDNKPITSLGLSESKKQEEKSAATRRDPSDAHESSERMDSQLAVDASEIERDGVDQPNDGRKIHKEKVESTAENGPEDDQEVREDAANQERLVRGEKEHDYDKKAKHRSAHKHRGSGNRHRSRSHNRKKKEDGDGIRAGSRSRNRKEGEEHKKKSSHRGRTERREKGKESGTARRHSLDAKLRKRSGKYKARPKQEGENSAIYQLSQSLGNIDW